MTAKRPPRPALGIDVYELREAKRQGCPAFRSGRVYRDEFLSWRDARELENVGLVGADWVGTEEARSIVARTIRSVCACANLGVVTPEQSFDFCRAIIEAANDQELREVFRRTLAGWLELNFSEIAEAKARKAHPKIMSWLRSENRAWFLREYGSGEFETKTPVD